MIEEIEKNIEKRYPELIVELDKLNLYTDTAIKDIYTAELHKQGAERLKVYTRFLSIVNCAKTSIYLLHKFVTSENWEKEYYDKILNNSKYLGFLQDLDTDYRFLFFHQTFSQLETYIRLLYRELSMKTGEDPFSLITKLNVGFTGFLPTIEVLRNTIHNNGYYFPIRKQPENFTLILSKEYQIKTGDSVQLTWNDTFYIFKNVIDLITALNKTNEVKNLKNI